VLEVSLRKAGFTVTPAESVQDALDKLELHVPDLIISETKFPTEPDGFELRRKIRASADWSVIPFVFLTAETTIENKIRGLELGVEDYLTKPIYIKEIVTRINILLAKKQRLAFEDRRDGTRFAGRVADMPVVDVIQTIEVSRKSGVIQFVGPHERQAAIYFRDGKVIDAEAGTLQGEDAVYRLLTWSEGDFEVIFRTVRRREAINTSSQGLLMEGMRRLDEWQRLLEQLPPLAHRFEIDTIELAGRLGEVPDDNNRILRLIDGKRSLLEVIDASDVGDLECLQAISRLYFEGMLIDLDPGRPARRDTGKPVPLAMLEPAQTPIEAVASGPIDMAALAARAGGPTPAEPAVEPIRASEHTIPTEEADVMSEEDAGPAPLMGSYRPSSLRLIDEAVAAAQLIEPSLFEEDTPKPNGTPIAKAEAPSAGNGVHRAPSPAPLEAPEPIEESDSVPTEIVADEGDDLSIEPPTDPSRPSRPRIAHTIRREDSGLRMIGSHGRDTFEASGELRPPPPKPEPVPEVERELVTIHPRRNTRELPAVMPPPEAETDVEAAGAAPAASPVEPPRPPPPPRRSVAGGVVAQQQGPGTIAKILIVASAVLVGATVFSYCHKKKHTQTAPVAIGSDAGSAVEIVQTPPADAAEPVGFGIDAATVAITGDAATVARPDAAPRPVDAAAVAATGSGSGAGSSAGSGDATDRVKQARDFLEKAHAALDDGDPDEALALADKSIALRSTARAYLERAKALQRLSRIDDALASVDKASEIVSNYAPAFEERGMILWSARRYDEARQALAKYLELDPNGRDAETVKKLLEEPR
jgi:CheY-like chemotaxis protein